LDIRHLGREHIEKNLRDVQEICRDFLGLDPVDSLIPVRPTQHYSMGGVRTDAGGHAYGLSGLYAVGEAGCWDLHGFNRLGGNSLAETIVMGMVVGKTVAEDLAGSEFSFSEALVRSAQTRVEDALSRLTSYGHEYVYELREQMSDILMEKVGVFRNGSDLAEGVDELQKLYQRAQRLGLRSSGRGPSPEVSAALRLPGMIRLAITIAYGALQRTESRGSHFREDYPARDDANWLKRTLATWPETGDLPRLTYEPVRITELPPGERGYGETQASRKEDAHVQP
jgi:fumarate reductase flavoprotein subunit